MAMSSAPLAGAALRASRVLTRSLDIVALGSLANVVGSASWAKEACYRNMVATTRFAADAKESHQGRWPHQSFENWSVVREILPTRF